MGRVDRIPQYLVGNHPAVCQIHASVELDGNHFRVYLDDNALNPASNPFAFSILVIAIHFDFVTNLESGLGRSVVPQSNVGHSVTSASRWISIHQNQKIPLDLILQNEVQGRGPGRPRPLSLDVGLQEPQPFVQTAYHFRKQVSRAHVAGLFGFLDGRARAGSHLGKTFHEGFDNLLPFHDVQR